MVCAAGHPGEEPAPGVAPLEYAPHPDMRPQPLPDSRGTGLPAISVNSTR